MLSHLHNKTLFSIQSLARTELTFFIAAYAEPHFKFVTDKGVNSTLMILQLLNSSIETFLMVISTHSDQASIGQEAGRRHSQDS